MWKTKLAKDSKECSTALYSSVDRYIDNDFREKLLKIKSYEYFLIPSK